VLVTPPSKMKKKFPSHEGEINCISINDEGNLFATGGNDKKIILYDSKHGEF